MSELFATIKETRVHGTPCFILRQGGKKERRFNSVETILGILRTEYSSEFFIKHHVPFGCISYNPKKGGLIFEVYKKENNDNLLN